MRHADTGLEMPEGGQVLVVSRGRNIVREAQTIERVLEMHVQQALICTIKRYTPLCHCVQSKIITHIWTQYHQTGIEDIRPSYIWSRREFVWEIKKLIGSSKCYHIRIHIYDLPELQLFPKHNLGESRVEVGSVHEVQIVWELVDHPIHRYDQVEDFLRIVRTIQSQILQ